jgi:acetyltransferase
MTTRNFEGLFKPRSIALVGASDRPGTVGAVLARNLLEGGFEGQLLFVNPRLDKLHGRTVHRDVASLPAVPELAVIATPATMVPGLVSDLGARGCRAAVVISAGFEGSDPATARLRQALLDAARPHLLRIVGPNCLGVLSPHIGVNASFARRAPLPGGLALVAQSGAVAAALLDWAPSRGLGFSDVVTLGDGLDVDMGDLLDHFGRDPAARAILLYVESIRDARKFMSAARFAARAKPVIAIKGGRSAAGAKAAFSHTGALAGADAVYSAAFRRAGIQQVDDLEALFGAAETFARGPIPDVERLAILTNGGGAGVLAVDALEREGCRLAELSPQTISALGRRAPRNWSRRNPVDILGDAQPGAYGDALAVLLNAPEVDAVLVINCPTAVADSTVAAEIVAKASAQSGGRKPLLANWLGGREAETARATLAAAGTPSFDTPEAAVRAFAMMRGAVRARELLLEAPEDGHLAKAIAREMVDRALDEGRATLTAPEAAELLKAYGVPMLAVKTAATAEAAGQAAAAIGGRVALKILSRDISHKSDVGGVRLGLEGARETAQAARKMQDRVRALRPCAKLDGFLVQAMAARPLAQEVLAGVVEDRTFGPLVMVGHGGVAVEVLADRQMGLPPLNEALARDMIGRTRVSRLLAGYRDRPAADLTALAGVLVALGRLAAELPQVVELDLNPLLCDADGVLAIDARVALRRPDAATPRLAILPYPSHLARRLSVAGETVLLRPIRPSDAGRLIEMVDRCTPEDVHLRFCGGLQHLPAELATRLAQIDYDRRMALVAEDAAGNLLGVGRLVEDPEGETAEFALLVRSDRQNRGLGRTLLQAVLHYARQRGLQEVWGDVGAENERMLSTAKAFGFHPETTAEDPVRVRVVRRVDDQDGLGTVDS